MKIAKSMFAAVLALGISSANAATIDGNSVTINIIKDGLTGDSMLIDTRVMADDFAAGAKAGTLSPWQSNTDLTTAISSFISGSSNVAFYVSGRYDVTFGDGGISTATVDPLVVGSFSTEQLSFISNANIGVFSDTSAIKTEGLTESWAFPVAAGDPSHYDNTNLLGNGFVTPIALGDDGAFFGFENSFGGGAQEYDIGSWNLSSTGLLSFAPTTVVPIPAAVWLFGSGLLGLVGVARRRKA